MFDLQVVVDTVTTFVRENQTFAPAIVFALAFGESLAVISLFIPATVLLLAIGALVEASGLGLFSVWLAATIGAVLGDAVSYWLGLHYKERAKTLWPLNKSPELVARAEGLFARFGIWAVAIGRFFGPIRAIVPLIAGILDMRHIHFQIANISSAAVWAFVMLAPGALALKMLQ
ncbi:DedA family protein [Xanthobacter sp. TB0136]|uniref:DedA family protein n=1 Tax=Xanthobacter sp. TB0136 TaxID=3459177 RepID=UPI004039A5AD